MFKSLFGAGRSSIPPSKLPQANSFVDVVVGGRQPRSVTVESVASNGIVTRDVVGRAGEAAVILYSTSAGRFRASTRIAGVSANSTKFDFPKRVDLVGASGGAQKRSSVRLDTLVPGHWRFAPSGKGTGDFSRATIRDISRGGCSLITDRPVKMGSSVEVRIPLRADLPPVTLLGEVVRHQEIKTSGKHSHGLRFHGVRPEEDHAIVDFINRKQAELRSRGLA
ncbi:MAG TPA: PilZ domain-containing protein [Verrucomicrobiae bacterium]|nr:PilZ domain-containing protein [Verrucomicrobiae bacterium]